MKMYKRQCSTCGIEFERYQRGNVEKYPNAYCSAECVDESKRTVSKLEYKCEQCFIVYVPKNINQKFCSHSCAAKTNNLGVRRNGQPLITNCPNCGDKLSKGRRWCGQECRNQYQISQWLSSKILITKTCRVPTFIRRYLLKRQNTNAHCVDGIRGIQLLD